LLAGSLGGWFAFATVFASGERSATYDEVLHLVGGWTYWTLGDYRLHPTNGNLTQRWQTAPYAWIRPQLPPTDDDDFRRAAKLGEDFGKRFLFESGNDHARLLLLGRAANAVWGLALGFAILRVAGWPAFALYCLCPNILAHAGLATSDLGAALGFFFCVWSWDRLLRCWTVARLWWSATATAFLFSVKMSAPLIVLVYALSATCKMLGARGWRFRLLGRGGRWRGAALLGAFGGAAAVHAVVVWATLWSLYGWRFSAFAKRAVGRDEFTEPWKNVLEPLGFSGEALRAARDRRLLPEAYLYGVAHTLKHARARPSFLLGQYSDAGWRRYFPIVFAIKTPLPTLALLAAATFLGYRRWMQSSAARRRVRLRRAAWWWLLIAVYGWSAVQSNLNIGFRHLLPLLPATFVLAGGVLRKPHWWTLALFGWLVVEAACIHPHQLAYFNQLVGGPANGYRCLVDSNLDWGQDLPGVARWKATLPGSEPAYLWYFGVGAPAAYGADLPPPFEKFLLSSGLDPDADLGGWYAVSATLLAAPTLGPPRWTAVEENAYRELLVGYANTAPEARPVLRPLLLNAFGRRLRLALHRRGPDGRIGYSILSFRMSNGEVREALGLRSR
jgi:hypothetical protein